MKKSISIFILLLIIFTNVFTGCKVKKSDSLSSFVSQVSSFISSSSDISSSVPVSSLPISSVLPTASVKPVISKVSVSSVASKIPETPLAAFNAFANYKNSSAKIEKTYEWITNLVGQSYDTKYYFKTTYSNINSVKKFNKYYKELYAFNGSSGNFLIRFEGEKYYYQQPGALEESITKSDFEAANGEVNWSITLPVLSEANIKSQNATAFDDKIFKLSPEIFRGVTYPPMEYVKKTPKYATLVVDGQVFQDFMRSMCFSPYTSKSSSSLPLIKEATINLKYYDNYEAITCRINTEIDMGYIQKTGVFTYYS